MKEQILKRIASVNRLKKELEHRGENDLEVKIKILEKEVDTLKAIVDLKDIEIKALSDNLKKIKDQHNKKVLDKFLDDLANNTPNDKQFK
jgi:predicted HTH domain antitoxin